MSTPEERAAELVAPLRPILFVNGYHYDGLQQKIAAALREASGRCHETGNLCGTDTRMQGKPCSCFPCQQHLRIREEVETAMKERCAAEAGTIIKDMVTVPCPDGLPGCEVLHQAPCERHRNWREIAAAIRSLE